MSGRCIIDYTTPQQSEEDNSNMKFTNNTQYVIEQRTSSQDLVVSKCETGLNFLDEPANSAPVKTLVYIKNSKAKFSVNSSSKLNNNFILSPASTANNALNKSISSPVILAGNRSVMLPKPPILMQQGGKVTGTYVTMLKPKPKPTEEAPSDMVPKIILTGPISKIASNRLPVTATTTSLQSGKFTLLPMPQKELFNFKITDGKIISNKPTPVTIMCDSKKSLPEATNTQKPQESERTDINNKTYELSIAEESLSNQSDNKLMVSSTESSSSSMDLVAKPPPGKFAHGISILKKNFANTIQDPKKPDIPIAANENEPRREEQSVTVPQKPEREKNRRKSQFSFRKDFDEMDMVFLDSEPPEIPIKSEIKEEKLEIPEPKCEEVNPKELLNIKPVSTELYDLISWDENIGFLPCSDVKFVLNEFGLIEYLPEDIYQKMLERKQRKNKEKEDLEREIKCLACGCYGFRVDFINANFCSFDCQSGNFKENLDFGKLISLKLTVNRHTGWAIEKVAPLFMTLLVNLEKKNA